MSAHRARRRPPGVVLGWGAVLAATVGLGIGGQLGSGTPVSVPPEPPGSRAAASSASLLDLPGRRPVRPMATRPPIGEDGVMGGLVFGTAWDWRRPLASER